MACSLPYISDLIQNIVQKLDNGGESWPLVPIGRKAAVHYGEILPQGFEVEGFIHIYLDFFQQIARLGFVQIVGKMGLSGNQLVHNEAESKYIVRFPRIQIQRAFFKIGLVNSAQI